MAVYGLIIAVENYPTSSGLAGQLPGTNEAAEAFCEWLERKKGVTRKDRVGYDPRYFFCCGGDEVPFRTHGSRRQEIVQAIADLAAAARDNCDELYCYLAGHGFCYPRNELVQEDIFVASDFTTLEVGGGACLKLAEIITLLASTLGPGTHYYFFDACRTEVPFGAIRPSDTGLALPRSQLGFAGNAVLFSVEQGLAARTDSGFTKHLVDGLHGRGRAKGWYNDELYVKFDLLWKYVQEQSRRKLSQRIGESEGLILKIDPIPVMPCTIRVQDATPSDTFRYRVLKRMLTVSEGDFQGDNHTIEVAEPGLYEVEVSDQTGKLIRVQPAGSKPVDLFDPAEVVFQRTPTGLESTAVVEPWDAREGTVTIRAARDASIQIRGMAGELDFDDDQTSVTTSLPAGDYQITLREFGDVVASSNLRVDPGATVDFDPTTTGMTPVHDAILRQLSQPSAHEVWFSESLGGPTLDRDLGLWLAYLGASRIVRRAFDFSKLSQVSLTADFGSTPAGRSGIYFLCAVRDQPTPYAVGLGREAVWSKMIDVPGVPGLCEYSATVDPGPMLVSFQSSGSSPPLTFASHALPNRATLLTLTAGDGRVPLRLYQFMLPIWSLMDAFPLHVRGRVESEPLHVVRFVTHLQRMFAQQHSVKKAFSDPGTTKDFAARDAYHELIYGKWLDPVGALVAAHDLLRQGVLGPDQQHSEWRALMPTIVANLRQYFPGIADTESLARAIGLPAELPEAAPLLSDSLTEYGPQEQERLLPFANALRLHGTPWVAWVNAVAPFFQPKNIDDRLLPLDQ